MTNNALGNFGKQQIDYSMGKFIKSTEEELQWQITYDRNVQITIYWNTI